MEKESRRAARERRERIIKLNSVGYQVEAFFESLPRDCGRKRFVGDQEPWSCFCQACRLFLEERRRSLVDQGLLQVLEQPVRLPPPTGIDLRSFFLSETRYIHPVIFPGCICLCVCLVWLKKRKEGSSPGSWFVDKNLAKIVMHHVPDLLTLVRLSATNKWWYFNCRKNDLIWRKAYLRSKACPLLSSHDALLGLPPAQQVLERTKEE